jgi:hypothetical protein
MTDILRLDLPQLMENVSRHQADSARVRFLG